MTKEKQSIKIYSKEELSKADNPILNEGQLNMLLSETPKNHTYERPAKGGGNWTYVTGIYVKKVLNFVFGWDWSFEIKDFKIDMDAKQCIVQGRLTINVKDRSIIKEQFGRSDIAFKTEIVTHQDGKPVMIKDNNGKEKAKRISTNNPLDLGNDLKAAATDALKKCASELGVASDIYGPDEFRQIRVGSPDQIEEIQELQKRISEQLAQCQDSEMISEIKNKLLEAEAHGDNTLEFYEEILGRFIS